MATTTSTDVKVYQPQFQGAFVETVQQNVDAFNAASRGALTFRIRQLKGNYEYEAFMDEVSSIARRDPSTESSSTLASTKLTQGEFISVKLHRVNGPYEWNISSAHLAGFSPSKFSLTVGRQAAVAVPQEMLNTALTALEAKLDATAALEHDATNGTIETSDLVTGLSKFGDRSGRIILWVMHSKVWFDLIASQYAATTQVFGTEPFGTLLFAGMPATLGRPVLVTDSASLISLSDQSTGEPVYSTLGLTARAAVIEMTELPLAVAEGPLTGSQNLYIRFQAEYGYNLGLRGCNYKTGTGANPTAAQVADGTNWETQVADNKLLPGIIVRSD
jgi:hypothetical protein